MKRLLLPLLAALALPTTANAESVWLLIQHDRTRYSVGDGIAMAVAWEKIEMSDLSQCRTQGNLVKEHFGKNTYWLCVYGK
ncbi:hypothetical protein [Prochlorococcus sp. MIT 1223]|uniref:hypothetical protein n=1 Tax=Prochlorococcus sp. MIT 1223 TaxID=3096217 RepID=UPI002A74883E|nr:hypothetical protein [Prochlorococcus sp. MIT 1223]